MRKVPHLNQRVALVLATSLLAGYTGVRTTAAVTTTVSTFKGQEVFANFSGTDNNGNGFYAVVNCTVGDTGNGTPTPIQTAWLHQEVDTATDNYQADTNGWQTDSRDPFTGSYTPIDQAMKGSATCIVANAPGYETDWNTVTGTTTDLGPVTLSGQATITGPPTDVQSGVSMNMDRNQTAGVVTMYQFVGKTGYNVSGTLSVSSTGGSNLEPISGAFTPTGSNGTGWVEIVDKSKTIKRSVSH